MNVAQVSSHYRPVVGGQEVYIKNLIRVLADEGIENVIYQLCRGERAPDAVCYPRVKYVARFIPGFESRWLNGCIRTLRPRGLFGADLIISHYAAQARPLASVCHKTIVLSHGVEWDVDLKTTFARYCQENARWCLNRYPHVVNDTHYLRHLGIDAEPAKGYFSEVRPGKWFIPNCVDTHHFSPGPGRPEYNGRKMILVPRQMLVDRGIHLAIGAFALLAKQDAQVELCLLGKRWNAVGPYIQKLDALIKGFQLQDRVYFRDPVPNHDMPEWYRSASVTLIPTLRREGTSLSALESMSCGIATVSTNVVGLADLPTVQCDPNAEAVAAALLHALSNRAEIGQHQRAMVNQTLNLQNWADCWKSVIHSVARR